MTREPIPGVLFRLLTPEWQRTIRVAKVSGVPLEFWSYALKKWVDARPYRAPNRDRVYRWGPAIPVPPAVATRYQSSPAPSSDDFVAVVLDRAVAPRKIGVMPSDAAGITARKAARKEAKAYQNALKHIVPAAPLKPNPFAVQAGYGGHRLGAAAWMAGRESGA
jgi:hypothetical protein